jgi:hypothetical protein
MRLWSADAISQVGSQVTLLALPFAAILVLHASAFELGVLSACASLPFLLIGLPAGVWVDRLRRRPIMVVADAGRAALLASVPVADAFGALTLGQLYAVAFGAGILTVFFDVSYQSYLPALVDRERLMEGNAKLEVACSGGQIAGPALGGALVQALGFVLVSAGIVLYNVSQISLRQAITPDRLLGRTNATMRFIVWGTLPLGALVGGAIGGTAGLRPTLWTAAVGSVLGILPIVLSPVGRLRTVPPIGQES